MKNPSLIPPFLIWTGSLFGICWVLGASTFPDWLKVFFSLMLGLLLLGSLISICERALLRSF